MLLKLNSNNFCLFLLSLFLTMMPDFSAFAAVRHPFQEKRDEQKLRDAAKDLPLYLESQTPDRQFEIIELVRSDGLFKKNFDEAQLKLRMKAYKLKADALVDVECSKVGHSVAASCFGHAVRWR